MQRTLKAPSSLIKAIRTDNEEVLKKELENKKYKTNPQLLNASYNSRHLRAHEAPLAYAARKGCLNSVKVLATHSTIDLNGISHDGGDVITRLCDAVSEQGATEALCETLKAILSDKRYEPQRHDITSLINLIDKELYELTFLLIQKDNLKHGTIRDLTKNPLYNVAKSCPENITDYVLTNVKLDIAQLAAFIQGAITRPDPALALKTLELVSDPRLAGFTLPKEWGDPEVTLFSFVLAYLRGKETYDLYQPVLKKILGSAGRSFWENSSGPFVWLSKLSKTIYDRVMPIVFNYPKTLITKDGNIHYSTKSLMLALLADPEFDINSKLWSGETLLSQAVIDNEIEVVLLALANPKFKINATNNNLDTAFALAAKLGKDDIVAAMLANPDIEIHTQNKDGHTPVMLAFQNQNGVAGNLILAHERFNPQHLYANGQNLAMHAAVQQQDGLLDYLFGRGVPVDATDADGNTALNLAVAASDSAIVLNVLIKHNANPLIANLMQYTPVMTAQKHGHDGLLYPITEQMRTYKPTQVTTVPETFFGRKKEPDSKYNDLLSRLDK